MFTCVWMVFSTKDRHVYLCVDGVQPQGQAFLPVVFSTKDRTGVFTCMWIVFSNKDRHVYLCVESVQHQGWECLPAYWTHQTVVPRGDPSLELINKVAPRTVVSVCGWCSAPGTDMSVCRWCSAPRTGTE
ncbi:hypothetical protein Bbelb_296700 [Branchiostoma belcheri]|nr:hypothetical protein Bbelb_296700 [Branchiostoma belcheri]